MRTKYFLYVFAVLLLLSCDKESNSDPNIYGSWKIERDVTVYDAIIAGSSGSQTIKKDYSDLNYTLNLNKKGLAILSYGSINSQSKYTFTPIFDEITFDDTILLENGDQSYGFKGGQVYSIIELSNIKMVLYAEINSSLGSLFNTTTKSTITLSRIK